MGLQEIVMQWQAASKQLEVLEGVGPAAAKDLRDQLDWQWLRRLLHGHSIGGVSSVQLQIGSSDALLPASYQPHDRLLVQVAWRVPCMYPHAFADTRGSCLHSTMSRVWDTFAR